MRKIVAVVLLSSWMPGCSDTAGLGAPTSSNDAGDPFQSGTELRVTVPEKGRTYVKLSPPAVVDAPADPSTSTDWDLAFDGFDVFTNSGASGSGQGGSFGPFDAETFTANDAPAVPFVSQDKTGGAFLDWYFYEGAPTHALWSRYHVYGIQDGNRLWKAQVLTYYGERDGASIAGLYKIRYAEREGTGWGPTTELSNIDATAGGPQAPVTVPSECLDLANGSRTMLTTDDARVSTAWQLCFRRQTVSVGGELGGPRGALAVDLDADKTSSETLLQLRSLTEKSEQPHFDAVAPSDFDGHVFRGDRIVSGFGDGWLDRKAAPLAPARATWIAVDASGKSKFLVGFTQIQNPTTTSTGTVVMRIKPVRG